MKSTTNNLPSELQTLASLLDAQRPEVQEAFQFLLATAMHEAGKFELLNVAEVDGRWHYTLEMPAIWHNYSWAELRAQLETLEGLGFSSRKGIEGGET